ncbi:MAG: Holliday junction branch migration protein RuvA [Actinomycetota bacterium]
MIAFLSGTVAEKGANRVVVETGGVGYDLAVPTSTVAGLPGVGKPAKIHTRMVVRDDGITLYGFSSPDERTLFDLLTGVTGVGPKVGLAFLSALTPDALRRAILAGDVTALTVVPGVGKKVAQRVVLDLKDTFGGDVIVLEGPLADVREALLSLGLTPQEATEAIAELGPDGTRPAEELLREALQKVGRA